MTQLLIQNRGEAPVEAFTLLGASLSRGEKTLLGKFGSGGKLSVCALLRRGLKVTVYTGLTRMEFKTKVIEINDGIEVKQERQVYIQFGGTSKKRQDLGWVLSMGEMDWGTDIDMALREFVSNAIDRTRKQGDNVRDAYTDGDLVVRIVPDDAKRAQKGYTRVFVEADEACQEYVDELPRRFLHFSGADLGRNIMPKLGDRRKAQVYYNGVWVRELAPFDDSLFDYNFTEGQISIDESRNLDDYNTRAAIAKLFRDAGVTDLAKLFRALQQGTKSLETGLDAYYLKPNSWEGATDKQKETWQAAWEEVNGDSVACGRDQGVVGEFARRKGHNLAVIDEAPMLDAVKEYGIPGVGDVLSDNERKGRTITAPTFEAIDAVNEVWDWITATDLIDEEKCPKPKVKGFDEISNAESDCHGFYKPGSDEVHIRNDLGGDILLEAALEEVSHYVTGATDCSRDFQNFLMRLLIRWLKK
jgi:hypothetical protein